MNERIRILRKHLKLTQTEFAEMIGTKQSTIATYESGRNEPLDSIVKMICKKFSVNETWLRTGKGDMLNPNARDEQLASFMGEIMQEEKPDFRRRLISALSKLSVDEWELLEKIAKSLSE